MISLFFYSLTAFAEEPTTSEDKQAQRDAKVDEERTTEASEPTNHVEILVTLNNGIEFKGSAPLNEVFSWAKGKDIHFTPSNEGSEMTVLSGDVIASIRTPSQAASSPSEVNQGPPIPKSPKGFNYPNPAASRYLYAPSTIGLQKGQGYISQKLLFTAAAYAPHDRVTLLLGTFTFFPPALTVFGAKYNQQITDNFSIGAGGEAFIIGFDTDDRIPVAVGFVGGTWGDTDRNITVSSGIVRDNNMISTDGSIIPLMVGAQNRFNDRFSLVTENWVFLEPEGSPVYMAGIGSIALRILGKRDSALRIRASGLTVDGYPRSTWDIGLIGVSYLERDTIYDEQLGEDVFSDYTSYSVFGPFPWVDYSWHFGPVRR